MVKLISLIEIIIDRIGDASNRVRQFRALEVMLFIGSIQHLYWGVLMIQVQSQAHMDITPLGYLNALSENTVALGVVLLAVSLFGFVSVSSKVSSDVRGFLVVPPMTVMLMTTWSSASAVARSSYADGVVRPWEFISADQWLSIEFGVVFLSLVIMTTWVPPFLFVVERLCKRIKRR